MSGEVASSDSSGSMGGGASEPAEPVPNVCHTEAEPPKKGEPSTVRDLIALTKPGIIRMCLIMTVGGIWLAPGTPSILAIVATLLGSAAAVGSANAFNMIVEREKDRHMRRTRKRPLPDGRLDLNTAITFATVLGVASILLLGLFANLLTAGLALFAIFSYVLIYTPMKYRSPAALVVGAVPGAIPPLLGWTAVTNNLDLPGVVLFAILMIWQIPHFIAIALYRKADYERAGIKAISVTSSNMVAKLHAAAWAVALIPVSMALTPLGLTGITYFVAALVLGLAYFVWSLTGLRESAGDKWARGYFFASLVYLPALTLALVLDVALLP